MKAIDRTQLNNNNLTVTFFGFKLTKTQNALFLMFSLMGIFIVPFDLAQDIFLSLFDFIFFILPLYLSEPGAYHPDYLTYHLVPIITSIITSLAFLLLSIYGLNKTLKYKSDDIENKDKLIIHEKVIKWLGIKITYGQSIFVFSSSLVGILMIIQATIDHIVFPYPIVAWTLADALCLIPTGLNQTISHEILLKGVPLVIYGFFLILCLYNLLITRRSRQITTLKPTMKNFNLLIFIVSFVSIVLLSARLFCHLALFNRYVASILSIIPYSPNLTQMRDFILVIVLIVICVVLMVIGVLSKETKPKEENVKEELKWFRISLTANKAIILVSLSCFGVMFSLFSYLDFLSVYAVLYPNLIIYGAVFIPIILFCYYPVDLLLKRRRFEDFVERLKKVNNFETKWFKFRLGSLNSLIVFSVSIGNLVYFVIQLVYLNEIAQILLSNLDLLYAYLLISFPILIALICTILVINLYSIKKTYQSVKPLQPNI